MTTDKQFVVAAMLAVSNMGMPTPAAKDIKWLKDSGGSMTLDGAVCYLADRYMETDEHYNIFMGEAKDFLKKIKKGIPAAWKDVEAAYDAA